MSRLIDAEHFKRFLQALCKTGAPYNDVIQLLDKEPTAYDTSKVVEDLEEERMRYFITIANTGDASLDIAYKEVTGAINQAIGIVRKGGIK